MGISGTQWGVPAGTIAHFAASTAPSGWLKANGATISRTAYAALFATIGTTYGAGDGATTFTIPDLRGEFLRALDDGRGLDSGRGIGTTQAGLIKSHFHDIAGTSFAGGGGGVPYGSGDIYGYASSLASGSEMGGETRPRNVAQLACIKF